MYFDFAARLGSVMLADLAVSFYLKIDDFWSCKNYIRPEN
jgi:hypothetical protein